MGDAGDLVAAHELVEIAVSELRAATRLLSADALSHRRAQVESAIAILLSRPAPPPADPTPSERTGKSWDTRRRLYGHSGQPTRHPRP